MAISKLILDSTTQMDVTGVTVTSSVLLYGYTAIGADGEPVAGGVQTYDGTVTTS